MRLSVISALARTNVDPWEEATRLAAMPRAIAAKTLLSILDLVSGRSWKSPEAAAIAARLVRLLPQPGEAATMDAAGTVNAAPGIAKAPQSTEKLLVAVVGLLAGDVIYGAAPSGSDIERAYRHIGIRRSFPIKEQHRSSGSSRSVPIVSPFGAAVARSSVTICSALNLFFGMTQAPFQAHFLTSLGLKNPGQNSRVRNRRENICRAQDRASRTPLLALLA